MTTATKTPFYRATVCHPERIGPYECASTMGLTLAAVFLLANVAADTEGLPKHYRWWDGQRWSFPLDYDPALDDGAQSPSEEHFPDPAFYSVDTINASFLWRGFTEDQDEL